MTDHVETLQAARTRLVGRRRRAAANLADEKLAAQVEDEASKLRELQAAIEAIDSAIEDEEAIKDEERVARLESNRSLPEWKPSDPLGDEPAGG
jgi:hypothetical protein